MTSSERYDRVMYCAQLCFVVGAWGWAMVAGQALVAGLVGVTFGQLLTGRRR